MLLPPGSALLVVDTQNDFCSGGALAVPDGDEVVPVLNRVIASLHHSGAPVYASRDWHPPDTSHFRTFGGPWPPHCVAGTPGAAFHPDLRLPDDAIVVTKGDRPNEDGYSAFEGRTPSGVAFLEDLRARGVSHLYVGGLATDYCVKHSALDARAAGLEVTLIADAVRAVNVEPADEARALEMMEKVGVRIGRSEEVIRR